MPQQYNCAVCTRPVPGPGVTTALGQCCVDCAVTVAQAEAAITLGLCRECGQYSEIPHRTERDCYHAARIIIHELAQGIEDLLAVAIVDEDVEGYVTAYHFKTGALHKLLGKARGYAPEIVQHRIKERP
jgi:hypothetical protein